MPKFPKTRSHHVKSYLSPPGQKFSILRNAISIDHNNILLLRTVVAMMMIAARRFLLSSRPHGGGCCHQKHQRQRRLFSSYAASSSSSSSRSNNKAPTTTTGDRQQHSYYETIDGVRYKREILELCRNAMKEGNHRISKTFAEMELWPKISDGDIITDTERKTLVFAIEHFHFTPPAKTLLTEKIKTWENNRHHHNK